MNLSKILKRHTGNTNPQPVKPAATSDVGGVVAMPRDNTVDLAKVRRMRTKKRKAVDNQYVIGGMDVPFFMLVLTLMAIGLVMLFSASYAAAYYKYGDATYFISSQALNAALGIVAMIVIMNIPYQKLYRLAIPALAVSVVLLVLVLLIGDTYNNATRWLHIPPLPSFQPSEVAKAGVVLAFSSICVYQGEQVMRKFFRGIVPFLAILVVMAGLLMKQPHLSATVIIMLTGIVIIYLGGARLSHLLLLGGAAVIAGYFIVFQLGYGYDRIQIWLDPYSDPSGDGFQVLQSLYALGSGGMWGLGLGQSRQKQMYLPEPYNDFIFSIVCEELGFVGGAIILLLFAAFILRGYYIAIRSKDKFGTLLAAGFTTQVAVQTIFNIGVVMGLLPVTGASLPFFSSGGTSLLVLFAEMGVILSVSKQIPAPKKG